MELKLIRETLTEDSTIGRLFVNGDFHCFTLEDKVREVKIKSVTAIPYGRYEVAITFSNRFQVMMPLLLSVPNYEGVRIHPGNYAKDTDGCILVGSVKGVNMIGNSKAAYERLLTLLKQAIKKEKIFLEIVKG
jgi:hypothetical protein